MKKIPELPGLNCGSCGYSTCADFGKALKTSPDLLKRCIYLDGAAPQRKNAQAATGCFACGDGAKQASCCSTVAPAKVKSQAYLDSLGRPFDFYLEHFPEDPGPREIIIPHNPMITRELDIKKGDVMIGRPLGMSCGCPITHCGIATEVDQRTGVMTWCVTGPLQPREKGYKDLGYYIAEGYEGL
ncbi:MAG TPA: (Fe-S)-binding protein, partial [Elusimicrobiales bacterium]|nr:(Fe-S)-binding protein [Elusimicrobiales bacterium]